jgi:Cdc6-like AAA superfamily ATPase
MSDIADGGTSDADFGADIPHALPPDPELVGRDAELASLRDFIQKHQATFRRLHTSVQVCITGVAGVGKSALATRLAYDLAGSYRGGALYLNLRDSQETGDLDISQVLRRFLHQLNQNPEDLPPSADLTDEYQRATNNKRLIVYLDNVTDYDSIEVLVPRTSTCLVIIT